MITRFITSALLLSVAAAAPLPQIGIGSGAAATSNVPNTGDDATQHDSNWPFARSPKADPQIGIGGGASSAAGSAGRGSIINGGGDSSYLDDSDWPYNPESPEGTNTQPAPLNLADGYHLKSLKVTVVPEGDDNRETVEFSFVDNKDLNSKGIAGAPVSTCKLSYLEKGTHDGKYTCDNGFYANHDQSLPLRNDGSANSQKTFSFTIFQGMNKYPVSFGDSLWTYPEISCHNDKPSLDCELQPKNALGLYLTPDGIKPEPQPSQTS